MVVTFFFSTNKLIFIVHRTSEENTKKKTSSVNSLQKKGKFVEKSLDINETVPQQNNSKTGIKNHANETTSEDQGNSESKKVTENGITEQTREIKNQKFKEGLKKKFKERRTKGKRLTFKEMKELAAKKRLQRQFRGAKKEPLTNLSAARLASYGLAKKKKK